MDFTSFRSLMSNSSNGSVDVYANGLNDITSIVDSFENGSFPTTYGAPLKQLFETDIKTELDTLLLWLNRDFIPCLLNQVRKYNEHEIKECRNTARVIKQKFTQMNRFLNALKECKPADVAKDMCQPKDAEEMLAHFLSEKQSAVDNKGATSLDVSSSSSVNISLDPATCCLQANDHAKFLFQFPIAYDSKIEEIIYMSKDIPQTIDIDELGQPTIQFKTPILFACLLCGCEVPLNSSGNSIHEHIRGLRHRKNKAPLNINLVSAYHKHWMQQELKYQAHQTYFIPLTINESFCSLCQTLVTYDLLQLHINRGVHAENFLKLYKNAPNKTDLLILQASVYTYNLSDSQDATSEEMKRVSQRRLEGAGKEEPDSDDSEGSVENKKVEVESKPSNANNLISASTNKIKIHNIIKSVSNKLGTSLEDLLENRHLPHLKFMLKITNDTLQCQCCQMTVLNKIAAVQEHINTKKHRITSEIPYMSYQFYCEICNVSLKQNDRWHDHMRAIRHIERCDRLGPSRKSKLTEYECKPCKLVIFGDDLSVKRHAAATNRNMRIRKIKEITLGVEVKALFKSGEQIQEFSYQLVREACQVLLNQEPLLKCCRALEAALCSNFPKAKAYPFGSRVSGLGNQRSDLDIFMDVGDMYLGDRSQDAYSQEKFVNTACRAYRRKKEDFSHVNAIPTARTPIVQVYHLQSRLDCDLSFRHGLSVENTKFLRLCIELQPITQRLILMLKKWVEYCRMQDHITTYALSMMVIFHLQVIGYLKPVHELRQLNPENVFVIDGWGVVDFSSISITNMRQHVPTYSGLVKELLKKFFSYYSNFNYATEVVCPLLGRPIKKSLFFDKPNGEDLPLEMLAYVRKVSTSEAEIFRALSPFCIQDPFDLSHNLVKACTVSVVDKFTTFCKLTFKHLTELID